MRILKKITICLLVFTWIFSGFPHILSILKVDKVYAANWLSGWGKRIPISIDHTKISSNLTYFPVLIHLSASTGYNAKDVTAVFTEIGSSRKKIAVTKDDGTTQMYAEIEKWNYTGTPSTSEAWIWVSKSDWVINNAVDTNFYLYYDNSQSDNTTYIGASTGSSPATNVWDSSYKFISHMNDDPNSSSINDSSGNSNTGSKISAGEPVEASIKIGEGQTFNGSNDIITLNSASSLNLTDNFAVEGWFRDSTSAPAHKYAMISRYIDSNNSFDVYQTYNAAQSVKTCVGALYRRNGTTYNQTTASCLGTTIHHIAFVLSGGNTITTYVDGAVVSNGGATSSTVPDGSTNLMMGNRYVSGGPQTSYYWPGDMDEIRIQTSARNSAWWKATYETERNNLLNFGSQETSDNYSLFASGFGAGGTASSSSEHYMFQGILGEIETGSQSSANYISLPGLTYTLEPNTPAAPQLTNPSSYYNKLKIIIDNGGNSTDTTFAIGISTDSFISNVLYIQTDNTLGPNPVFQTYASWGSGTGFNIIGLTPSTTYYARVAAKRGTFQQGAFGPTASASTIDPTFTFNVVTTSQSVPPFSINLGELSPGSIITSSDQVTATISTNASNGGLIYINDTNSGLKSSIAGDYLISSATNDLSSPLEGYGAQGTSVTQTSGGPMEINSPYNGNGQNVGILDTSKRQLADSSLAPVSSGQISFNLKAKAKTTTPAAPDYSDILTLVGTGNF